MMAKSKTKTVSKTSAIRQALAKHNGSPKLVAAALAKKGIQVTPQYVSVVKATDKRKAEDRGKGPAKASKNGNQLEATKELFTTAIDLVLKAGSAKEAHRLVDSVAEIIQKSR